MANADPITTTTEEWRPVVGFEGIYEVSDHGRVRSVDRLTAVRGPKNKPHTRSYKGTEIQRSADEDKRLRVRLTKNGRGQTRLVHQLVLEAFTGPRPGGMDGCHNDGNPSNNHAGNLRWDTKSENMLDKVRHGTDPQVNKINCPRGHEFIAENLKPSSLRVGRRSCLACHRASAHIQRNPHMKEKLKEVSDS